MTMLTVERSHRGRRRTFYLGELLDGYLIHIGKCIGPDSIHDSLVLSVLSALSAALELILLQAEPRRSYLAEDAPRLQADLRMLREYFVARDELNEINGLPEDVVDAELSYLAPLVELMGESSDDLLAALFDRRIANIATASHDGSEGSVFSEPLPEWNSTHPSTKCNVSRILLDRAKGGDAIAQRFVAKHKEAVKEMLGRHPSIQVERRHGKGVGRLRERIEEIEAEERRRMQDEERRHQEAATQKAEAAAAAVAAAAVQQQQQLEQQHTPRTPRVGVGSFGPAAKSRATQAGGAKYAAAAGGAAGGASPRTSAVAEFFAKRSPPNADAFTSPSASVHRQPSQGSRAAGLAMAKAGSSGGGGIKTKTPPEHRMASTGGLI